MFEKSKTKDLEKRMSEATEVSGSGGRYPDKSEIRFVADIIADCDGQLRVSPGYRFVNRIDSVLCEVPWTARL